MNYVIRFVAVLLVRSDFHPQKYRHIPYECIYWLYLLALLYGLFRLGILGANEREQYILLHIYIFSLNVHTYCTRELCIESRRRGLKYANNICYPKLFAHLGRVRHPPPRHDTQHSRADTRISHRTSARFLNDHSLNCLATHPKCVSLSLSTNECGGGGRLDVLIFANKVNSSFYACRLVLIL